MNKRAIGQVVNEIALLLELKGENAFKVRAYYTAARAIETFNGDWNRLLDEDRLEELAGVGAALAEKIKTLATTGELKFYDELVDSIPSGLIKMLRIPGLGPKRIKLVHNELGIDSVAELKAACEVHKVSKLSGFGKKTEANILKGIEMQEMYNQKHLWYSAHSVAKVILEGLLKLPEVLKAEFAGSLRRCMETVGDVDFIVAAEDSGPVMDWFTSLDMVVDVIAKGETKSSVMLKEGIQADLRVVPMDQFYFALHHFTGSKDHNILMRKRALKMGYSLSEWGLKADKEGGNDITHIESETELFSLLKLPYIEPELREGIDELELAEDARLPKLIEVGDIRGVFHNHTTASDGSHSLVEMVERAELLDLEYLGIADHSKSSYQANGLSEERLLAQVAQIRELNASKRFTTHVFAGTECDILPDGSLDFEDWILNELDYVVVAVHSSFAMDEAKMTKRIIKAIEHPKATMLAHMTGRLLLRREPYGVNVEKIVDAAIANNVVIELNSNPYRLDIDWRYWRRFRESGLFSSINPDAHSRSQLAFFKVGVNSARKGGLTAKDVINTRPLEVMKDALVSRSY